MKFFTLAMGFMVMTGLGCGDDKKSQPKEEKEGKAERKANPIEIKKAEALRLKAETERLKAEASRNKTRAAADRERRKLLKNYDFDKDAKSGKPATMTNKGKGAQFIAHKKGGGTVQVTVPKGWQTAPKRFKRCTMLRSEQKTLVCRVDGTRVFYDACILKPRRSRTVYVGGVRILGDEEEYTREEIAKFGEELLELLPRATGNINISCWAVPLKRVLRGRSYYANGYRHYRRQKRRRAKRSRRTSDDKHHGDLASKRWVKRNFATKDALKRETSERKKADDRLRAMYRKVRRAVQPKNTPPS